MQRLAKPGRAEETSKKSRFIGVAETCADEREVLALLRRLAGEHPQANHLAFAYRLKTSQGWVQRFHDAGEPAGTAGKPILQHLEGRELINACVAVVRYFGGIKLGAGGLARAYGNTAKAAIDAAGLEPFVAMRELRLIVDYGQLEGVAREVARLGGRILAKEFGERITVSAVVPEDAAAALPARFGGN